MNENELVVHDNRHDNSIAIQNSSIFTNADKFEFSFRVATMLSRSDMVPQRFRGEKGVPNAMVALDLSNALGAANVFMTMQSIYDVHGRIGIDAKMLIAMYNQRGRGPIRYEIRGDIRNPNNDSDGCIAYVIDRNTNTRIDGPIVDWLMVKKEGWYDRKDKYGNYCSKWRTMPELMFRYRAAAVFIRINSPEVTFGMYTTDELIDMQQNESGVYEAEAKKHEKKDAESIVIDRDKPVPEAINRPQQDPVGLIKKGSSARNPLPNNGPQKNVGLDGKPTKNNIGTREDIKTEFKRVENDLGVGIVKSAINSLGNVRILNDGAPASMSIVKMIEKKCDELNKKGTTEQESGF